MAMTADFEPSSAAAVFLSPSGLKVEWLLSVGGVPSVAVLLIVVSGASSMLELSCIPLASGELGAGLDAPATTVFGSALSKADNRT